MDHQYSHYFSAACLPLPCLSSAGLMCETHFYWFEGNLPLQQWRICMCDRVVTILMWDQVIVPLWLDYQKKTFLRMWTNVWMCLCPSCHWSKPDGLKHQNEFNFGMIIPVLSFLSVLWGLDVTSCKCLISEDVKMSFYKLDLMFRIRN